MKLVNVVQRERLKKELENQIKKIAPNFYSCKNMSKLMRELVNLGLVSHGEKTYVDIRMQAKKICYMIEKMFGKEGYETSANICLIDAAEKKPGVYGKLVHLSGPNLPDDYVSLVDGMEFTPFSGICGRAVAKNTILKSNDLISNRQLYSAFLYFFQKYNIHSVISCPIHIDNEIIGILAVFGFEKLNVSDAFLKAVEQEICEHERVFAAIQEQWKNLDVMSWKYIIAANCDIYYAEETVTEVFGYEPQDCIGSNLFERYVHPDDTERTKADVQYVIDTHKTNKSIHRIKDINGDYITVESLFIPITDGSNLRYIEVYISVRTKSCNDFDEKINKLKIAK